MTRVKGGFITRRRHNKLKARAKGFQGTNNRLYKRASDAVLHAGEYAFAGRKNRKRDFRRLWITRMNTALRALGMKYSEFIKAQGDKHIELDRKVLADLAVSHPTTFEAIVKQVKAS